jgi:hypothetical protein
MPQPIWSARSAAHVKAGAIRSLMVGNSPTYAASY